MENRNLQWNKRVKVPLILIFSVNTNHESVAYRSFSPSKFEARGARKVTTGIALGGLPRTVWSQAPAPWRGPSPAAASTVLAAVGGDTPGCGDPSRGLPVPAGSGHTLPPSPFRTGGSKPGGERQSAADLAHGQAVQRSPRCGCAGSARLRYGLRPPERVRPPTDRHRVGRRPVRPHDRVLRCEAWGRWYHGTGLWQPSVHSDVAF